MAGGGGRGWGRTSAVACVVQPPFHPETNPTHTPGGVQQLPLAVDEVAGQRRARGVGLLQPPSQLVHAGALLGPRGQPALQPRDGIQQLGGGSRSGWVGAGGRARASGACLPPPLLHHRPRPWRSLAAPLHHRPGSAALARTASGWGSLRLPGGLDAGEAAGRGAIEMGRSLRACGPPWRCAPPLHRLACCLGAPAGR